MDLTTVQVSHGEGLQTYRDPEGNVTLQRSVSVWVSQDGRYRAKVQSLDGSGAAEEVSYDGAGTQLILITAPGGSQSALRVAGSEHFAIDGGRAQVSERLNNVVKSSVLAGDTGSIEYELTSPLVVEAMDSSILSVAVPDGVEVVDEADASGTQPVAPSRIVTIASGSNSQTMNDYVTGQPCLYAYNYRNGTSNFFTTNSQVRSACTYIQAIAWAEVLIGDKCFDWKGKGPQSTYYSSWTGYFEVYTPSRPACSSHGGWDSGWVLVVAWRGLAASVLG